jgi:hypothetical protein
MVAALEKENDAHNVSEELTSDYILISKNFRSFQCTCAVLIGKCGGSVLNQKKIDHAHSL